jgi:RNA polymerase sigma factor (sigma-70 family)
MEEPTGHDVGASEHEEIGESSFEAFFFREQSRLLKALFVLTGNKDEAEELSQDAFVAVLERWDRVAEMHNPTGYLYRTAMNHHLSHLRRASRAARRAVHPNDRGDVFASIDERDALARALSRLSSRERAAIVLTELLGYDASTAAQILGVRPATVRSLASQGRSRMKGVLGDDSA